MKWRSTFWTSWVDLVREFIHSFQLLLLPAKAHARLRKFWGGGVGDTICGWLYTRARESSERWTGAIVSCNAPPPIRHWFHRAQNHSTIVTNRAAELYIILPTPLQLWGYGEMDLHFLFLRFKKNPTGLTIAAARACSSGNSQSQLLRMMFKLVSCSSWIFSGLGKKTPVWNEAATGILFAHGIVRTQRGGFPWWNPKSQPASMKAPD